MKSSITINAIRGRKVAKLLNKCFATKGIFGKTEMPEDILPKGVRRGSLNHVLFITLTVAIDYQRDANKLWEVSRKTWEDPKTRYLFHPEALHQTPPRTIARDMQKYGLSKKQKKDANIWRTVGVTFYKKWQGNPNRFLESCGWDSTEILNRLKNDSHFYNGRDVADYPYLRGDKIGPLWLRMLRDNVGIDKLKKLKRVPIPVDVHVARATLTTGVVSGRFDGTLTDLFEQIREAWFQSVETLKVKERRMIALDVDEPLWHLSKYGCTHRDKESGHCPLIAKCEAEEFCVTGKLKIEKNYAKLDT